MPEAWDTSVVSHVWAGGRHAPLLAAHLRTRTPVPVPAPTVQEVVRGLGLREADRARAVPRLRWFSGLLADPLAEVIAFDRHAAVLAGRLLAVLPHPPTGHRRREGSARHGAWTCRSPPAPSPAATGC